MVVVLTVVVVGQGRWKVFPGRFWRGPGGSSMADSATAEEESSLPIYTHAGEREPMKIRIDRGMKAAKKAVQSRFGNLRGIKIEEKPTKNHRLTSMR